MRSTLIVLCVGLHAIQAGNASLRVGGGNDQVDALDPAPLLDGGAPLLHLRLPPPLRDGSVCGLRRLGQVGQRDSRALRTAMPLDHRLVLRGALRDGYSR